MLFRYFIIFLLISATQARAENTTSENILNNDMLSQTDWALWLTSYDKTLFEQKVWHPAQKMITYMDALEHIRSGYRNDYSKKQRRQLQNTIREANGQLLCITEYPNAFWPKLLMIVKAKKAIIPADLEFSDKRLRDCEDYLVVPEQPITFENIDCIYYQEHCHLQWVYRNGQGKEEMTRVSFKFHYDLLDQINPTLHDLDLIQVSGTIHFLPSYWHRELPLTQITKIEKIIDEAVVIDGSEHQLSNNTSNHAMVDDLLKTLGNSHIQGFRQNTEFNGGFFMVHPEESITQNWGEVAYQRVMQLITPPAVIPAAEQRKQHVKEVLTNYHLALFCADYQYLAGFDKSYIKRTFKQDPKNDLSKTELNTFGVRELAILEMQIKGHEGQEYCSLIQLQLVGGTSFFH